MKHIFTIFPCFRSPSSLAVRCWRRRAGTQWQNACLYVCICINVYLCKKVVVKPMLSAVCLRRSHGKNIKRNCSKKAHWKHFYESIKFLYFNLLLLLQCYCCLHAVVVCSSGTAIDTVATRKLLLNSLLLLSGCAIHACVDRHCCCFSVFFFLLRKKIFHTQATCCTRYNSMIKENELLLDITKVYLALADCLAWNRVANSWKFFLLF